MFRQMEAPDYQKKTPEDEFSSDYSFSPHVVEDVDAPQDIDLRFNQVFDLLSRTDSETHEESVLATCGALVGEYILSQSQTRKGETKEVRGLAAFQGFFERELIKRGDGISHYFRNPAFISAVNKIAPFAHAERMTEKIVGAQSTHAYIEQISKNKNVVFVGSETDFDVDHSIDLVVGLSDSPEDSVEDVDEIWLTQVKTSMPKPDKIESIIRKHTEYAKALKEFEGRGVGTSESEAAFFKLDHMESKESIEKYLELRSFYDTVAGVNSTLEPTWESIVLNAKKYNFDPVLFYIRLKLINPARLGHIKKFKQTALYMAKEQVDFITVPQEEFAKYNRATRGETHISSAKRIRSKIIAEGREISNIVLA